MNTEASKQTENKSEDATTDQAAGKRSATNPGILLLVGLLGVTALLFSGFNYYITSQAKLKTNISLDSVSQIRQLDESISALQENAGHVAEAIEDVSARQAEVSNELSALRQQLSQGNLDWALAEVEQLLIIAGHRLLLESDVNTALAAMRAADTRLKDIAETRLLAVRRQLMTDINNLASIQAVDISGLAMYLADIVSRAQGLPLHATQIAKPTISETSAEQQNVADQPAWQRFLSLMWSELKGLVIISKRGEAVEIALLPEQAYYLRQNLRLQLESARLSVLRRDTENLRASIVLIQAWMQKYFDSSAAEVNNILESLTQMAKIELHPSLPDISSSLESLRAVIRGNTRPDLQSSEAVESPAS